MSQFKLDNGLTVNLIDKPGFLSQFAVVMVDFGGLDRNLPTKSGSLVLPAGTAHFLEHQLFNKADGDISQQFAEQQAQTNAFTTASKTAYYFSGSEHLLTNLDLLARLVGEPYFQLTSVQNERQIISQEIKMYQDQPDWQLDMQLLGKLYPDQPIAEDIAGDLPSLQVITPAVLFAAHQYFYQPQRMQLTIVADLKQTAVKSYLQASALWQQLGRTDQVAPTDWPLTTTKQIIPAIPALPTANTKTGLGLRGQNEPDLNAAICLQLDLELALTTLFGEMSLPVRQWRDAGLIDDNFQFNTTVERQYNYVLFTANSPRPQELLANLQQILQADVVLDQTLFERVKREMVGNILFSDDALGGLGLESAELGFYGWQTAEIKQYLTTRQVADVQQRFRKFLQNSSLATVQLVGGDLEK
ncbi:EF-P 5-aminopentanol modification-associated protein YfmH [Lapidilactobacillus wuchangensis]|uniref:EF-P 5-aminopentanol modification-associated protein YfmH n=1 Tax=Lapidilactobacillus wuchangensis TaxID=2486001 RepID=UPI000F7676A1|nr:pitrilysin family protein [Lapidilactobacillus wuchangensis]